MVLDRYILRLWFMPFVGALIVVVGMLLLGRVLKLLALFADKGIEWGLMVSMLFAILPYFLLITVPMAFFFAMQHVVLRLYETSEMDAFRAAGISFLRLFRSLLLLAVVLAMLLEVTAMQWMPQGQKLFQGLLMAIQKMKPAPGFEPLRFNQDLENFTVYVQGQDADGRFKGFMLEDRRSSVSVVYMAKSATLERIGDVLRFTLFDGVRLEGDGKKLRSISFERYQIGMDLGALGLLKIPTWQARSFEMQGTELLAAIQEGNARPDIVAEWHRRLLMPTTLLVLFLFCLPLSHTVKRASKSSAYILGIALMVLLYNVQLALHQQVTHGDAAWWVMWLGQAVFLLLGFWLFYRATHDRMPTLVEQGWFQWLQRRVGFSFKIG
ncbi:MAG: LptF/LptG family permease [Mariprofundaceae bacterium]|nr:LptF/LptG family permease [Mariprofundaceae bacterium]